MFSKESFLKESQKYFLKDFNKPIIQGNRYYIKEPVQILGEIIDVIFNKYDKDEVIDILNYNIIYLEESYDFYKEEFSGFNSYKDAIAYFSLNQYFLDNITTEIDELFNTTLFVL